MNLRRTKEEQELLVNLETTMTARDLKERYRQQSTVPDRSLPDTIPCE